MPEPSLIDAGSATPCPAPFNMAAHTFAPAARVPNKVALEVLGGPGPATERWTHGALAEAVRRTAAGLAAQGLAPRQRLLLRLGNSADFPLLFFAANALGAVPVPVSAQLTAAELGPILEEVAPRLICLGPGLSLPDPPGAPVLDAGAVAALRRHEPTGFAATGPDDPAYMVLTSGTASRPKAVLHAQRAAWARRMMWDGWYGLTAEDRVLHAGALNWTYTLGAGLTDPWAAGATALVYAGPADRTVWPRLAAAHRATIFAAVPGVFRQMLAAADLGTGFASTRHGLSAGEALADPVRRAWTAATGRPIHEALGMSEISTYVSGSPSRPAPPGATGYVQPGRRVAVLPDDGAEPVPRGAEGLLAVAGTDPGLMLGYWNRPEATAAAFRDGWFLTGDRARMQADGAISYLGRADDLMNAGGFRVSPAEVEAALSAHAGVAESAVVALPVGSGATVITAFYVPRTRPVPDAELAAHCADRLARYKCPRAFRAVAALPRDANGKLLRRRLRDGQGGGGDR
jgi:acyl-coenzyme A synthetase/AMP-(fatty) acid ligase